MYRKRKSLFGQSLGAGGGLFPTRERKTKVHALAYNAFAMSDNLPFHSAALGMLLFLAAIACPGCDRKPEPAENGKPKELPPPATVSRSATAPSENVRKKVEIILPEGPPTDDTVEDGTYVLSLHIDLDNGASVDDHHACSV